MPNKLTPQPTPQGLQGVQ